MIVLYLIINNSNINKKYFLNPLITSKSEKTRFTRSDIIKYLNMFFLNTQNDFTPYYIGFKIKNSRNERNENSFQKHLLNTQAK